MDSPKPLICTVKDCKEERADQSPDATNRHCRTHRNEATKKYLMSKAEQEEAKAFHKGVEAMREHIANGFDRPGESQKWTGGQIARIVRNVKPPALRDAILPTVTSAPAS